MEILWWLAFPAAVTLGAMIAVSWLGRPQRDVQDRSEADHERFASAITRAHPGSARTRPTRERDRSTGIAVRPSRRGVDPSTPTRRSA